MQPLKPKEVTIFKTVATATKHTAATTVTKFKTITTVPRYDKNNKSKAEL